MDGTQLLQRLRGTALSSLCLVGRLYHRRANGDLVFEGNRPGPRWQGHGYFCRKLRVLQHGQLRRVRLWKHRWRHPDEGTCHSRPPDEMERLSVCVLVHVLSLFGWLSAPRGLHAHQPLILDADNVQAPSARTMQRWLRRALPSALQTQQAYRLAVIERCEPRPVESLFPGGLSPPVGIRRPWRDPPLVAILWRGYALTLGAALKLDLPAAVLLAEARGREVAAAKTSTN